MRRVVAVLPWGALRLGAALLLAAPASAHTDLVSSTPTSGARGLVAAGTALTALLAGTVVVLDGRSAGHS